MHSDRIPSLTPFSFPVASLPEHEHWMFMLSNVFDPRYAFLFYSPLIFSLDRVTGRKLMWVSVIAEWSNQVLKWIMRGERPYWWVREYEQQQLMANTNASAQLPPIEQTFMTCETGPGSPSGHAMVTAAVWYIIFDALLSKHNRSNQSSSGKSSSLVAKMAWALYTLMVCAVSLSRIYLAAHFPHQCLLGMIMGVAVGMLVSYCDTDSVSRRGYILGVVGMFATAMVTYALLLAAGFNPSWSVERALKWCAKREHVHLDTTPFFSMMRYLGFFLGMGFGLHSSTYRLANRMHVDNKARLAAAFLSVLLSKASEKIPMPANANVNVIYGLVFAMNVALPYIFIGVIPYLVGRLLNAPLADESKQSPATKVLTPSSSTEDLVTKPRKVLPILKPVDSNNNIRIRSH